jgi:hypothetical protein
MKNPETIGRSSRAVTAEELAKALLETSKGKLIADILVAMAQATGDFEDDTEHNIQLHRTPTDDFLMGPTQTVES